LRFIQCGIAKNISEGKRMRFRFWPIAGAVFSCMAVAGLPAHLHAQQQELETAFLAAELPEAPQPQSTASAEAPSQAQGQKQSDSTSAAQKPAGNPPAATPPPEPKRILGLMPNYRAVSAGVIPPPPTTREAFKIATENSFDYSAFIFVGITSLLAEGDEAHPQLGKGVPGFWAYTWRGFVDKTDGNYMVDWIMPTVFHQDERYYAMGEGGIWKRGIYSASRELITPNYHGKNSFNASEILGRGIAEAVSLAYYPSQTQTASGFGEKYAYAVGRDALTNVVREFWPDIDSHLIHRHRHPQP
jgi:hypothetical protein